MRIEHHIIGRRLCITGGNLVPLPIRSQNPRGLRQADRGILSRFIKVSGYWKFRPKRQIVPIRVLDIVSFQAASLSFFSPAPLHFSSPARVINPTSPCSRTTLVFVSFSITLPPVGPRGWGVRKEKGFPHAERLESRTIAPADPRESERGCGLFFFTRIARLPAMLYLLAGILADR